VAVNVWYHVGPANEPRGRSGFAHLFEHLMFEGSRHVGRRMDQLLESVGATNANGTTSWDRTSYFETVPRQHLELVLWIESDRMGYLSEAFTLDRFGVQRDVVKNERRQTYENAPYGPSELALYQALFPEHHPYHGAVIGSMADLDAASVPDVAAFYDAYYAPSNATLALAGDFDRAEVRSLIEKYFGSLRTRPRPPRAQVTTQPLLGERRVMVDEPVELARVTFG
jgi:zinc protease